MQKKQGNHTRLKAGAGYLPFFAVKPDLIIIILALMLAVPMRARARDLQLLRIGTGGRTGVYYPIGKLIAQGLTESTNEGDTGSGEQGVPGYVSVAQNSAGSVENVEKVAAGEIEAGMAQADVAFRAFRADPPFQEGKESLRGIRAIASLYPEKLQIVVRRDAEIRTVSDLKGKRISVDEIGSGSLAAMRIVLAAYHLSEDDLQPVYLKPVFTHDKIVNGELQGFVAMAGTPMAAVNQLLSVGISLVPVPPEVAAAIEAQHPYLVPALIATGTYAGVPQTATLQVHALLVVHQSMPDPLAYAITAALWGQRTLSLLKTGHPQGAAITPETALAGLSIPLHPGAEKYYQENAERFKVFRRK